HRGDEPEEQPDLRQLGAPGQAADGRAQLLADRAGLGAGEGGGEQGLGPHDGPGVAAPGVQHLQRWLSSSLPIPCYRSTSRAVTAALFSTPPVEETRYSWIRWNQPLDLLKTASRLRSHVKCGVELLD